MTHLSSIPAKIKRSVTTTETILREETRHVKQTGKGKLATIRAKLKEIKVFLHYVKITYYNKPFLAVYLPTRATYSSIWMLVPGGLYNFQQLGFDPIGIQAVTAVASSISAVLAPINGLLNDKFKNPQYITAVEQATHYAAAAGRTIAPTPDIYMQVNTLESFSNGQLDWANKVGATLNRGKYRSTAKMLFRVINQVLNIVAGFAGAYIYQFLGASWLIAVTVPLIACGLAGYLVGSRKYSSYWNKQMEKEEK
jgi:hypothetical protein